MPSAFELSATVSVGNHVTYIVPLEKCASLIRFGVKVFVSATLRL